MTKMRSKHSIELEARELARLFDHWRGQFMASCEGSVRFVLALTPKLGLPATQSFKRQAKLHEKIRTDFLKLCKKYRFDPSRPAWRHEGGPEDPPRLESGQLSHGVAAGLLSAYRALEVEIDREERSIGELSSLHRKRRRGPIRPDLENTAYDLVLVGLELFAGSREGLQQMKDFFSQGGTFVQWLKSRFGYEPEDKERAPFESVRNEADPFKWANQFKLYLWRLRLSCGRRQVIKNFEAPSVQAQKREVTAQIAVRAQTMRAEVLSAQ